MRLETVATVIVAALLIFNQQSYAQSSGIVKVSPPAPANVPGYYKAHCVSLSQGIRICKGLSWLWAKDPKGKRGDGLYLIGQWWRYSRGQLIRSSNHAIIGRRYLESFAVERDRTIKSPAVPFKWLSGPKAERLRFDPLLAQKNSEKEGVITNVSSETADQRSILKIEFKPDYGAPLSFIYPQDDSDENGLAGIGDLVVFGANRVYPSAYIPTSPDGWLKGRRATVVTYGENHRRILWLRPKSD